MQLLANSQEPFLSVSFKSERPARPAVAPTDALRGFFHIMDAWKVGAEDARILLGSPPERTYYSWRQGNGVRVPQDTLRRIGYIAGIFKALQIVYSNPQTADGWIQRPNKAFGDLSPLERMRGGDVVDLAAVRSYIDAARAPWS
jgi:uncharacterized protein (DUF2384 family)